MIQKDRRVTELESFNEAAATSLSAKKTEAKDNVNQVYGDHWNSEDKLKFSNAGRIPVDMPILFPKVLAVVGHEKANRETFEGEPVGKEDELVVQVLNALFRDIENNPNPKKYEHTKSDVFVDGFVACFGASEVYTETDELGYNQVKVRHIPYDQIVFDPNFYDVECTGMSRIQHCYDTYLDDLYKEFPGKEETLREVNEDAAPTQDQLKPFDDITQGTEARKKVVKRIRDWKKINTTVYRIYGTGSEIIEEYGDKKEAEERKLEIIGEKLQQAKEEHDKGIADANAQAQQLGQPLQVAEPFNGKELSIQLAEDIIIKEVPKQVWEYSECAGSVLLQEPKVLDVDDECPITLYFSIFMDGQFYTPITIGKKLQKYADRLFAQADYSIGIDAKGGIEVNLQNIDKTANTADEVIDAYTRGRPIFTRGEAIKPLAKSGGYPHFAPMFELLLKMNEDMFGGRTFQGAVDHAGQSGKAIQRLQMQANLMALQYMDNLRRYDLQVGRKILKYIQHYYTHEFSIKVLGESMTEEVKKALMERGIYEESEIDKAFGFVYGNRDESKIAKANLTININKVSARQDEKEILLDKYAMLMQQGFPIPPELIVDALDLPPTKGQILIKAYEDQQKAQEEARKMEIARGIVETNLRQQSNLTVAANALPKPENPGEQ